MKKTISKISLLCGVAMLCSGAAMASGGGTHWGYEGHEGPESWGDLSPEYAICKNGKNQSPIDISETIEAELQPIAFSYSPSSLDALNNGHSIKASYAAGSSITVDGHTYELKQIHWHTPSENTIDGKSYPMEAHFVHADANENLAVIGLMYEKGAANSAIASIWENIPAKVDATSTNPDIAISAMDMLPASKDYYRFNGSLTTPPCSEGVRWMVMKDPVQASAEQIEKFHGTFHGDTNRPVQPTNARLVLK